MDNPFTTELVTVIYHKYLREIYGIGKPCSIKDDELTKLRARFKLTQNNLYKIDLG